MQRRVFAQRIYHERMIIMEFKKTVAGISAAAIAVTQVAAVIPMGAFAAEEPVSSGVGFALKLASKKDAENSDYDGVYPEASAKKAVLSAKDITNAAKENTDLYFSYGGLITGSEVGDKYTFTADDLMIVANPKSTTTDATTKSVWDEAAVDLDGTTENGKLTVTDAGSDGDNVVITYTEGADPSIKVSGVETESGSAEDSKTLSFTLDETTAKSFDIVGSGVTVTKIEVTSTRETTLIDTATALTTDGSKTVTVENGSVGDTVVITYAETPDFNTEAGGEKADVAVTGITDGVKGEGTYTFKLTDETKDSFTVTGNGYTVSSIKLTHTATEDKTPAEGTALTSTKTPGSVTVAADKLADAVEKGSVKVTYAVNTAETAGSVVIKAGDTEIASFEAAADKTEATVELDAAKAAAVKDNGIVITGKGVTVSKVELVTPGKTVSAEPIVLFQSDEPVVWSQEQMSGWWQGENPIDTSAISDRIGTIEAFGDNFENITVTWSDLTATKTVPDEPVVDDKGNVTIWSGKFDLGEWTNNFTELPAYSKAEKNGTFTINYTVNDGAEYAQLMLTDKGSEANSWKWTDLTEAENLVIPSTNHSFTLTDTIADSLKNGRIVIKGANVTLTSVTYKAPASSGEDKKETVLFDGSTDMGTKWGKSETIAKFNAVKGGTITAEFEEGSTEYWQLKFMDSSWEVLSSPKTNQWGSVELGANATKYSFDLNAADAKAVSSNGMIVSGYGITLKKLTYTAPTGEVEEDKLAINAANFPDTNFRKVLTAYSSEKVKNVPVLTEADIAKITDLGNEKADGSKDEAANLAKVVNFKGIEKLTALKALTLTNTQRNFKALDLSENAALTFVDVSGCTNLADLKLPETAAIEMLLLQKTAITAVDVSKYTGLKLLNVSDTKLTALDVKANTELETLALANVKVAELDVKANTALKTLDAANCGLTKIDVSANTLLEDLDVSGNSLITLDLTGLTALTADKFKADNNKRNIGTVIDNTYDLKDLVADGLDVDKMTITTEGVTRNENVLTDVKGNVTYTYETGLEADGLDKVTFTLAPEKVTSENFEVSYMDGAESKSVVCETWDEVLKAMTDKNVEYSVTVKKDVTVDKLTMPTAAKAKSVTIAAEGSTITTKSASVTLPTDTWLINVKIKAVDKDGKTLANTFTLNASKDLKIAGGLEIEAKASTIKGGAKSVLKTVRANNEFDSEITGFGTVRVYNGAVTFNNTVKVKELDVKNGSVVEIGKNAAVTVTNITSNGSVASKLVYTDAEYKPVTVTGDITGNVKLEVGISYKKTAASTGEGQEPTTTRVSRFAKDDVVLVAKSADIAAVDASESLPEGATLGRDKSDIKVMDTVATMNGVEYAQWSDITSTIAAAAKADKNSAKTAVYNITLSKELDAKGALKMPAAGTFGELIIKSDAAAVQTLKFTGNLALTGKTTFENVKLDSAKTVRGVTTYYDFSISAGKNDLTLSNVTSSKSIKSISSNGTLLLDNVTVTAVNGATVEISNSSTAQHSMGALVDGKWQGVAAPDTSVVVEGNLTAKTALRFVGNESGLRVMGVVNAAKITADNSDSVLVVDKLAKNKNALIIGKGGFDGSSKAVKFVLMDAEKDETAQITENLTLGTIAGPYADQFIPSDSNLAESDSYYIIKSGKNLVAVPKQTKGEDDQKKDYLVEVTVNNKKAYYKNLDEAIKDINEIGTKTTDCVIKLTPEMFEGKTLANLPLPNAGKYDHLYYSAESDVTINVTSDLALTGNLTLSTKITLNKVDKKDGSVQPINISLGKYGLTIFNVISADHSNGEESAPSSMIGNITGTGRINMNGNIVINGKVAKTVTFYAQDASIILEGAMSAFEGTITAPSSSSTAIFTYDKSNAKNVKFQEISGFKKFTLAYRGEDEIAEGDIIASIAGDYSDKNTVTAGSTELVVVRSGNNLKAVNKNDVLTVQEYSGTLFDTDDDEEPILIATRSYDTFANAVKDIERIKNPIGNYAVYAHKGDVLVLPKAKTYDTLMVASTEDATESYAITTAKDLTLTGNLVLMNINLDKVVKDTVHPMSINLGNYKFMAYNSHVSYDADNKVSRLTNINGIKGTFALIDNMTISGKVNVGTFIANSVVTFGEKAGFAAATEIIVGEGFDGNYPEFIYPLKAAKNIDLSNIDTGKGFDITVEGAKEGDQVAAVKGDMIRHDIKLNDEEFIIVRSGNKLVAAKDDTEYTLYAPDQSIRLFDTYDNAVAYITKLNNANGIYEITLPESADKIELKKLTLPTKGKYSGLSITASNTDGTTIIVNSDIALTGDLALKGDLTLMKDGEKLLKITSPLDSKTKQPLYQFTLVDYANVVNGTFNGTPIETPEVEKTVIEATLPYSSDGGVDLAENILKFGATKVVKKGTILVTFKDTATFALYDADGNLLANASNTGNGYANFDLTDDQAAKITAGGFTVSGKKGIVTGVKYSAPPVTVTEPQIIGFTDASLDLSEYVIDISEANVAENGVITVIFKEHVANEITLRYHNYTVLAKKTLADGATSLTFTLTAYQASEITANGFYINGDAGVVTSVTYTEPVPVAPVAKTETFGDLGYTGSVDLALYVLKINAKSDVAAKGTITVTLENAVENSIEFKKADESATLKTVPATSGSTTYTWELSDEEAVYIAANGFYIVADAGVVTSVTYTEPKPAVTPGKKGAYEGSLNYNGDGIDLSRFVLQINKKAVVENGTITVTLKEEVTSSVIFKKTNRTDVIKTVAPTSGSTTYTWVLSADDAAYIAENGFVIDGTEGVLTSVTYTAPEIPGIDD